MERTAVSAAEALRAARAAGIEFGTDGDDLVLEPSAPPAAMVLNLLMRHKLGIVALLRSGCDAGRRRTGRSCSRNGQASPSSTAVSHAPRPKPSPSPAASSN